MVKPRRLGFVKVTQMEMPTGWRLEKRLGKLMAKLKDWQMDWLKAKRSVKLMLMGFEKAKLTG